MIRYLILLLAALWLGPPAWADKHQTLTQGEVRKVDRDARKITIMVINPITPETETTSHFWIGWARDFALDDNGLTQRAQAENTQVIMEDVRVIEGQQRVLSARPGLAAVAINADGALVAVHKVLERLRA